MWKAASPPAQHVESEWGRFAQSIRLISRQAGAFRQSGHAKASGELASPVFRRRTPEQSGEVTSKMSLIEVSQRCGELRERLVCPLRKSPGCLLEAVPPNDPLGRDADILPKQPLHRSNCHSDLAGERLRSLRAVLTAGSRDDRADHFDGRVRLRQSGMKHGFNGTDHGRMIPGAEDLGLCLIVVDASHHFGWNRSVRQGGDWLCQEWPHATGAKAQSDDPSGALERAAMDTPDHTEQFGLPGPDDKIGVGGGKHLLDLRWPPGEVPLNHPDVVDERRKTGRGLMACHPDTLGRSDRIDHAPGHARVVFFQVCHFFVL